MSAPRSEAALADLPRRLATKRARHWPQWRRARRALWRLLADSNSTEHALEVIYALDGDVSSRRLERMLQTPEGRRLYFERPDLLAVLSDREALAAMPEGSFGRAYLAHIEQNGFDPASIPALRKRSDPIRERDAGEAWFAERVDLTHDLWHVLTGYGADSAGEAAVLTFTQPQTRALSYALLGLGIGFQMGHRLKRLDWPLYLFRAWRRGRRAALLDALPYEELLPLPLAAVRDAAGIEAPELAHPGGLIRSQHRRRARRKRRRMAA